MGLGGFSNFAEHESGWFEALGFRLEQMPASRYLGINRFVATMMRLPGRDAPVLYPIGLECNGSALIKPYCPPYYPQWRRSCGPLSRSSLEPKAFFEGAYAGARGKIPLLFPERFLRSVKLPLMPPSLTVPIYTIVTNGFPPISLLFGRLLGFKQATSISNSTTASIALRR